MSSELGKSFHSDIPRVTSSWLNEQRNLGSNDVRFRVTGLVQRSAREVLGPELEMEVEKEFRHMEPATQRLRKGIDVVHAEYAPTVASFARIMEWDEGDPPLTLLSTRVYERALAEGLAVVDRSQDSLAERIHTATDVYVVSHSVPEEQLAEVQTLDLLFDADSNERKGIKNRLERAQDKGPVLQSIREKYSPKSE